MSKTLDYSLVEWRPSDLVLQTKSGKWIRGLGTLVIRIGQEDGRWIKVEDRTHEVWEGKNNRPKGWYVWLDGHDEVLCGLTIEECFLAIERYIKYEC